MVTVVLIGAPQGLILLALCHHDAGMNFHLERALDGGEDRGDVAHGRITRGRQHTVQALCRLVDLLSQ